MNDKLFDSEFPLVEDGLIVAWDLKERLEEAKITLEKETHFSYNEYYINLGQLEIINNLLKEVHKGDTSWIEKYRNA